MKLFGIEIDKVRLAKRRAWVRVPRQSRYPSPGILDQLRAAGTVAEIDRLLARLSSYTGASQGTRSKAARIAARKRAELTPTED